MVLTFPSVRKLSKSSSVITLLTTGIGRAVAAAILIFTCLRCLATVKFIAFRNFRDRYVIYVWRIFQLALCGLRWEQTVTVPYFSLRSSRSRAFRYGRPPWMSAKSTHSLPRYRMKPRWPPVASPAGVFRRARISSLKNACGGGYPYRWALDPSQLAPYTFHRKCYPFKY